MPNHPLDDAIELDRILDLYRAKEAALVSLQAELQKGGGEPPRPAVVTKRRAYHEAIMAFDRAMKEAAGE